ncbi:thiamine biosynthesis lipoprotein [Paraperlucidibaca baekdonensis]|uniref:FAD:protein FMN transferase n=1 Tax=Paraperlucidibaca baekdonensis TaxID=748120 RepID=A0A3E0H3H9_9GAMM|nr:FAD:protein FMN transferase [Paraperlucidibaca baekdonensis]REH37857.1 thiamine biosynthesis lipoprotein [Paraperlucidibaca baekdonensis]
MAHRIHTLGMSLVLSMLMLGCQPATPEATEQRAEVASVRLSGTAYHSMAWQVSLAALPTDTSREQLQQRLQARLDAANTVLSTYQSDTELMRFNRASVGEWHAVSPMLLHALSRALQVSAQMTSFAQAADAYDVTVSPLVNLWGFGSTGKTTRVPTDADTARAKAQIGWQNVQLESKNERAQRLAPVTIDLSSVGEGAAVDALSSELQSLGVSDFLVSVAGTLKSRGNRADGSPWRVAIERPDGQGGIQQLVVLSDGSLSTSGSYRNYFERNGVRYSHTIDPRTGKPITHNGVSVTVISPVNNDATLADAWATALSVLSPELAIQTANKLGLAAYVVAKTADGFDASHSAAFTPYLPVQKSAQE